MGGSPGALRDMLLTITTTHSPATDIGFLLEKHPEKVHESSCLQAAR